MVKGNGGVGEYVSSRRWHATFKLEPGRKNEGALSVIYRRPWEERDHKNKPVRHGAMYLEATRERSA